MPYVAVILPVYNAAATLECSVRSLLAQTHRDMGIIAVDDGSTDGSGDVLKRIAGEDGRLQVRSHSCNRGICAALNNALAAADAPYVARMDADDWSHPERLRKQLAFLQAHPDVGMVGCKVEYGGDRASQAGYAAYVDWTNAMVDPRDISLNRFVESPFAHPSVMFRAELPQRLGGYEDGPFPEDYELWLRWLDAGVCMAKIPEVLLKWSDPPDRLSRTDARYSPRAFYQCKAFYLARWLQRHNPHHPDVVVWGAGRETRKRAEMLVEHGVRITHYVDIDPRKVGQVIHGRPVLSPGDIPPPGVRFMIPYVGSRGAREQMRGQLTRAGYVEGRDFVMAA